MITSVDIISHCANMVYTGSGIKRPKINKNVHQSSTIPIFAYTCNEAYGVNPPIQIARFPSSSDKSQ